jgi:hypothetical protein
VVRVELSSSERLACLHVKQFELNSSHATTHCTPCSEVKHFEELANRKVFNATARTQWRVAHQSKHNYLLVMLELMQQEQKRSEEKCM